ncbi:unnamed protein product, partial [Ectocarpus sp. 12 AP-2014]
PNEVFRAPRSHFAICTRVTATTRNAHARSDWSFVMGPFPPRDPLGVGTFVRASFGSKNDNQRRPVLPQYNPPSGDTEKSLKRTRLSNTSMREQSTTQGDPAADLQLSDEDMHSVDRLNPKRRRTYLSGNVEAPRPSFSITGRNTGNTPGPSHFDGGDSRSLEGFLSF